MLSKTPSKGGLSNHSLLKKSNNFNNFKYFNGMKIRSSVPSTPTGAHNGENGGVDSHKPESKKIKAAKMIALKKNQPNLKKGKNVSNIKYLQESATVGEIHEANIEPERV